MAAFSRSSVAHGVPKNVPGGTPSTAERGSGGYRGGWESEAVGGPLAALGPARSAGGAVASGGGECRPAQQGLDGQRGGAEGDGVRSQAAELDRGLGERVAQ